MEKPDTSSLSAAAFLRHGNFKTSSYTQDNGTCVKVAAIAGLGFCVGDTTDPRPAENQDYVSFGPRAWAAFMGGIHAGALPRT